MEIVELFALFHDSRRVNEYHDPGHGQRGGLLAREFWGRVFSLDPARLEILVEACDGHTDIRTHDDITIATCWDADRLDLGRVSAVPDPRYLAILFDRVDEQTSRELVRTAHGRASFEVVPEWIEHLLH